MEHLFIAVKRGMEARKERRKMPRGIVMPNPYAHGSEEFEAFEAGRKNDLAWWMLLFRQGMERQARVASQTATIGCAAKVCQHFAEMAR